MQTNFVSHVAYQGDNQQTLNHAQIAGGFKENTWMTFLQARSIGRSVKQGEKGVLLCKVLEEVDKETKKKKRSVKRFVVFNLEQTEIIN